MLVKDPIYQQLNSALRGLIGRESFKAGSRFLTEREVGQRFGVSRATANKALAGLVSEGLLEFRKGVGTFVRGGVLDDDLRSLVSFTDKARIAGKKPTTKVLRFETVSAGSADDQITVALGVRSGEDIYFIERLRMVDDLPVIIERRWVVARFCPELSKSDLRGSLYALWTGRYKLEIADADQSICAVNLRAGEAKKLRVPNGSAALFVTSVGRLSSGEPLWYERILFRGDAYEFHNQLGPIRSARPASGVLREVG
jgi:GntR family transcriptional regulator